MTTVYVALGGNIDPARRLPEAAALLRARFPDVRFSPAYASAAVGFDGADFINAVARFETGLAVADLVAELHTIEERCGRSRSDGKWAPRAMDIDLLLYGELVETTSVAQLPRPDLARRAYMLGPLASLAPQLRHPLLGATMRELWRELEPLAPPLRLLPLELNAVA